MSPQSAPLCPDMTVIVSIVAIVTILDTNITHSNYIIPTIQHDKKYLNILLVVVVVVVCLTIVGPSFYVLHDLDP